VRLAAPMFSSMLMLNGLQSRLGSAIRGQHQPELLGLIEGGKISPEARLRIYRNHLISTLTATLKATFPVVCRLVDERFFGYAAHEFIAGILPSRPCLAEYGERFPDFLGDFPPCRRLIYLADVARLEWAINLALHAEEPTSPHSSTVARGDSVLALHPSLQLVQSRWPIDLIWRANQPDGDPETVINLDCSGARLLAYSRGDRVVISGVEPSTYAFLEAIDHGARLPEAIAAGRRVAPTFDPMADLGFLLQEGVIVYLRATGAEA
jgi:hypothetical protein